MTFECKRCNELASVYGKASAKLEAALDNLHESADDDMVAYGDALRHACAISDEHSKLLKAFLVHMKFHRRVVEDAIKFVTRPLN